MPGLVLLAADEPSKVPYYAFGIALVLFALAIAAVGISRHETFPPSAAVARGIMALAVVLVAGTMLTAVLTS